MSQFYTPDYAVSDVICRQPGRYIGWPTIDRLPEGELVVVFSGDRDLHNDPFGKTFLIRSRDEGKTWSGAEVVNDTPLDDRDAGLCVCDDGTMVVSWFTSFYEEEAFMRMCPPGEEMRWREKIRSVSTEEIRTWAGEEVENGRYRPGYWVRRSTDGGASWGDPIRVPCSAPHGPIALSDGRLLFVGIENIQGRREGRGNILAVESADRGLTWRVIGRMSMFPAYAGDEPGGYSYLCEPHVVEASSGDLVSLARYEEFPRNQPNARERSVSWQFVSTDGGHTWSEPSPTNVVGKPPHLARLRDGRLLLTYGYRFPPYGERACLSRHGGAGWDADNQVVIRDDAPSGDLGYPASIELTDGTILSVYYQQERPGEKTVLMATRWRLPAALE